MRYFYANGAIHPFEDGEVPQWAKALGEDSDFRILSEDEADEYARQQGIKDRGFDISAAQWSGSEQAMAVNPATGQMELIVNTPQGPMLTSQAAAAGIAGTPLMKPKDMSSLAQWGEFGGDVANIAKMAASAYGMGAGLDGLLGGFNSGGLQGMFDYGRNAVSNTVDRITNLPSTISSGLDSLTAGSSVTDGVGASDVASTGNIDWPGTPDLPAMDAYGNAIDGTLPSGNANTYLPDGSVVNDYVPSGNGGATAEDYYNTQAADDAGAGSNVTGIPAPTGGGGGGNVYGPAATTAIQRILNGTGTEADWIEAVTKVLPGVVSAVGSNEESGKLYDLYKQYFDMGAPSRGRFEASMTPGFDPMSIPGYSGALDNAMQAQMRKLSTQGNPFGNPGGLIEANKSVVAGTALPAIRDYQGLNMQAGGFGTYNAAAPGAAGAAIKSGGDVWSDLGSSFRSLTSNQTSLDDLLKKHGYTKSTNSINLP